MRAASRSIGVRLAALEDVPWLDEQLAAFAEAYGTRQSLYPGPREAHDFLARLVANHPVFIASRRHGTLEERLGLIAGTLSPHPMNAKITVLAELFWWVAPEHRGCSAGARLLEAFMELGRREADWIVMTLESDSTVSPESLERRGFRLHEQSFLLETA